MNRPDHAWQTLLELSRPTFRAEVTPPFGFSTRTLARWKAEKKQQHLLELIGMRAVFASLTVLALTLGLTFLLQPREGNDLDPGVRSLAAVESVSAF